MFKATIISILSFTAFAGFIGAQDFRAKQIDPEKAALIEEMMTITRPDKLLAQLLEGYKKTFYEGFELSVQSQLRRQNEYPAKYQPYILRLEYDMFTILTKRLTWDRVKPRFIAVYDETFSKQELRDIVTFYKTPSGQSLNRKMPILTVKCLQAAQEEMGNTTDELQTFIAEFQRDVAEIHRAGLTRDGNDARE